MSDQTQRHASEADERVREQVEADRRAGRDLPAPGDPADLPKRSTRPVTDPDPTAR